MVRPSIEQTMLRVAAVLALRSTCTRRQVGCVLTDSLGRILSTGYNGVARGQPHCIDKPCPGAMFGSGQRLDLCQAIHAEQNALLQCKDVDKIDTCYVTCSPCVTCTKLLLNTPCQRIVFAEVYEHKESASLWIKDSLHNRQWVHHEF